MRKVLVVSHHFPPVGGGAVVRVHSFVKYLPRYNWLPVVLTVANKYYPSFLFDESLLAEYDQNVRIERTNSFEPSGVIAQSLQTKIYGTQGASKLFQSLIKPILRKVHDSIVIPDDQILWMPFAIKTGLRLIREQNIELIFATTPPHSVGMIGAYLSYLTKIPFVLDVRDDWVGNPLFDHSWWHRKYLARLCENRVMSKAKQVIAVTPESVALFYQKYPYHVRDKFVMIPNGYDSEELQRVSNFRQHIPNSKLRLVYAGGLPTKRSPQYFFQALGALKRERQFQPMLQVEFYGYARQEFQDLVEQYDIADIVQFRGFVSRQQSLEQIASANATLLIIPETEGSSTAIPGKIYEYLGLQKFVLALCSPTSAVARLVKSLGIGIVASPEQPDEIKKALEIMLAKFSCGELQLTLKPDLLYQFERSMQADQLAKMFNKLVDGC